MAKRFHFASMLPSDPRNPRDPRTPRSLGAPFRRQEARARRKASGGGGGACRQWRRAVARQRPSRPGRRSICESVREKPCRSHRSQTSSSLFANLTICIPMFFPFLSSRSSHGTANRSSRKRTMPFSRASSRLTAPLTIHGAILRRQRLSAPFRRSCARRVSPHSVACPNGRRSKPAQLA